MKTKDRHDPTLSKLFVRLTPKMRKRLKKWAKREKLTETDAIRELIMNHCTDYEED